MSLNEARQDAENRCLSCAYLVASGVRAPTWRSRVRCFLACVGQRTHARKPVGGPLDPRGRAGGRAGGRAKQSKGAGSGASDRPLPGAAPRARGRASGCALTVDARAHTRLESI